MNFQGPLNELPFHCKEISIPNQEIYASQNLDAPIILELPHLVLMASRLIPPVMLGHQPPCLHGPSALQQLAEQLQ